LGCSFSHCYAWPAGERYLVLNSWWGNLVEDRPPAAARWLHLGGWFHSRYPQVLPTGAERQRSTLEAGAGRPETVAKYSLNIPAVGLHSLTLVLLSIVLFSLLDRYPGPGCVDAAHFGRDLYEYIRWTAEA
jgi:hypothetical protein